MFLNLILLLLLQICYSVLHSSARARCPTLSRSASVTMATAMDQTVAPTWLPKGNCSSQAVSVCMASHMSDKHNILAQSSVTFVSLGKPSFPESPFCALYAICMFSAHKKSSGLLVFQFTLLYTPAWHTRDIHNSASGDLMVKLELCSPKYSALGGLSGQLG